jgi:hypothetical protein
MKKQKRGQKRNINIKIDSRWISGAVLHQNKINGLDNCDGRVSIGCSKCLNRWGCSVAYCDEEIEVI